MLHNGLDCVSESCDRNDRVLVSLFHLQLSNTLFREVTGFLLKEAFGAVPISGAFDSTLPLHDTHARRTLSHAYAGLDDPFLR